MRLIEVAKKLGMTGQELRRELSQVDFGVKPTDREVPDSLALGILRFVANKHGIQIQEDEEGSSSVPAEAMGPEEEEKEVREKTPEAVQEEEGQEEQPESKKKVPAERAKPKEKSPHKLHVLRKLSLEGVSDEAVRAQAAAHPVANKARKSPGVSGRTRVEKQSEKKRALAVQQQIKKKEGVVELPEAITVKEFAEKTGVQVPDVIATLMKNGVMANINQDIDYDTAAIVAEELGVKVKKVQSAASAGLMAGNLEALLHEDDGTVLQSRPPIVTVMGHVDHGKTAILDAIRKTDVVSGEAGGITQSIGAYQVDYDGKSITFIDTPGHEAFTAMRARGAQITDIVVLVVAVDEGVKPTTVEAIAHAKEAGVPILVALNKTDKEGADPDRVKGELAQHELQPEEWGGKTPSVLCSAKTGQGITDLLEHILILSEMEELKANPHRAAVATVIESHLDSSMGPVVSVVINAGTLRIGDICVCGTTSGKVKLMIDSHSDRLTEVGPAGAVRISGLSAVPQAGDILQVVENEAAAKKLLTEITEARAHLRKRSMGDLISRLSEGKLTALKIVLKADSVGSLEAIESSLADLKVEGRVVPKIIHAAVGDVSESDVMMAAASDGVVLGFSVSFSSHVERIAAEHGVKVLLYEVIYELLDEVKGLLDGLVEPEEVETVIGHLEIRGTFFRKKSEQVVGGKVTDGVLKRVPFRLMRPSTSAAGQVEEVAVGRITSLQHVDKEIKEAKEGKEYGLRVDCSVEIKEGDVLEGYVKTLQKKA